MGCARVNRKTAREDAEEATNYDANALNQYTAIGNFAPQFDADGKAADGCKADWTHAQRAPRRGESAMGRARINQTRVQTSTGIWNVTYNAENRPVTFDRANTDGTTTRVTCTYDHMGRRATKKVETISAPDAETGESTATTLHQRYLYRNYLQIACCDLTRPNHPHLWFLAWDPTQPIATRPLALRKDGTWYCYGWDLTKNICEVFSNAGYINNTVTYSYTPYGTVTAEGTVQQAIQWSSEFYDEELGLVYYNYRHYNPMVGRWLGRDSINEYITKNLYDYCVNNAVIYSDWVGRTIEMNAVEYNTLSHITNSYGVYAYTGDANGATVARPQEEGEDVFETKVENGKCCVKVRSAKKLVIKVKTVLPSDWNIPMYVEGRLQRLSESGYQSVVKHEESRRAVYQKANEAFLTPAETTGAEVTKCGWICQESEDVAKRALSGYLNSIRTYARMYYDFYVDGQNINVGMELYRANILKINENGVDIYELQSIGNPHKVGEPQNMFNVKCPG